MSLKFKVALLTLLTALSVGIGSAAWTTVRTHDLLLQELRERGVSIGTALAETLVAQVASRDQVGVIYGLRRLLKKSEGVRYVYVTDFDGQLFGHSFEGGFPEDLGRDAGDQPVDEPRVRQLSFGGWELIEVSYPLVGGMGASVTIAMDAAFAHEQIKRSGWLILATSVSTGVVVSLLAILLSGRLLAPISFLAGQMRRFGRGEEIDLVGVGRASGSSETDALAHSFLDMISERQHAEAQLNQIKNTLDNTLDAVFMFYPDSLKFFYVNRGAQQQVGYSEAQLMQMTPVDIKPDFDRERFLALLEPLLSGARDSLTLETRHRHRLRHDIPVEISLQYMAAGDPPHFLAMVRDISERKQAEQALHAERLFNEAVLDNAGALILVLDAEGRIRRFNAACERLSGYSAEAVQGRHPWDMLPPPEERDAVRSQAFDALVERPGDGSGRYVNHWQTREGKRRLIEWHNTLLADEHGQTAHVVSIGTDITERHEAELALQRLNEELERRVAERTAALADSNDQLRDTLQTLQHAQQELVRSEKLASLGSLVAGVAHELNTPLGNAVTISTTLQGWLHDFEKQVREGALRRSTLNEFLEQANQAGTLLVRNLGRAAELITDFKQVAVDQTSAQRRDFDLAVVITEIVETLQPQFKHTPHKVVVEVPEGIKLDSYPGPLGQVITNLALNALAHGFADDGHGVVNIRATVQPQDKIALTVADNGQGIPADHIAKVFDPFFTTKLGKGGSGLGLHIVYTLVTRVLGGTIEVRTPAGGGAEFVMVIPLKAPQGGAAEA